MSESNFNKECEFAARQKIPRLASITLSFVVTLLIVMLAYTLLVYVDIKTTALGSFDFSSKYKHFVESKAPGEVSKVFVKTGQKVKKGDLLVKMHNKALEESYQEEAIKAKTSELALIRLESERDGIVPKFANQDVVKYAEMVENEMHLYEVDINEFEAEKNELEASYLIAKKEFELMKPLIKGGHVSKFEMQKQKRLVDAAKSEFDNLIKTRVSSIALEIKTAHQKLSTQNKKVARLYEQVLNLDVISPQDGIIASKSITTRGANIKKGDRVLELVDIDSPMQVVLNVSPDEIGFVKIGQIVNVKIDSYDFSIYGKIDGKVTDIAYTPVVKNAETIYEVTVEPATQFLEFKKEQLAIIPGMTCVADILTNKVSLLTYLLKPVMKNYVEGDL